MTELTTYTPPAGVVAVADYQTRAVQRLGEWAHAADAAFEVARRLVETSFVPQAFRGKPIEATAAILAGSEVGLSPMSALKAFDVIQGQAAPRAITLRAIVQSFGHELVLVESTATRCRMKGRRAGSTEWQNVTWTIDRAKDLGLTGKDNWRKQPGAMLVARATSELARLIASDAILGIGYTAEEVADGAAGDVPLVADGDEPAPTRRTLSRRTHTPAGADAPDAAEVVQAADDAGSVEDAAGDPSAPAAPPPQDSEAITRAQLTKIAASMTDLGITPNTLPKDQARAAALAYVARVIGREVESRNDLTKAEAHQVIEALEYDLQADVAPGQEAMS